MNNIQLYFQQQLSHLEQLIQQAEIFLKHAPNGTLIVSKNKFSPAYYWRQHPKDKHGKYLKKSQIQIARDLAQKDYTTKFLKLAKEKHQLLTSLINIISLDELKVLHTTFRSERQSLITPYITTDDSYLHEWENFYRTTFSPNDVPYPFDSDTEFWTEKEEQVRSKSEKIIADKLSLMNIPYIYEAPLILENQRKIYPDFTLLNIRTRNTIYWEHFGMMDNPDYSNKTIRKIDLYQRNGILSGKNLIITYETSSCPLNTRTLESLIKEFLL